MKLSIWISGIVDGWCLNSEILVFVRIRNFYPCVFSFVKKLADSPSVSLLFTAQACNRNMIAISLTKNMHSPSKQQKSFYS